MEVDKRSVLPRALKIDHARNPAVFRQGCTRCFVEQNRFVARFRLEFAIEVALLPRQQQYAVGLEGLVVVRVDFDGVGPRPQERRVVVAAPPVVISRTLSSLPDSNSTSWMPATGFPAVSVMVPRSVAVSGCANSKADDMEKSKNRLNRRTMLASLLLPCGPQSVTWRG